MKRLVENIKIASRLGMSTIFVLSGLILSACGSSNPGFDGQFFTFDLQVISTSPQAGEQTVDPTLPLSIRFSEPVATGSLNASTINLTDITTNTAVTLLPSSAQGGLEVVLSPTEPLANNRQYRLQVANVQGVSGSVLRNPLLITFATGIGGNSHHIPGQGPTITAVQYPNAPFGNTAQLGPIMNFTFIFSECVFAAEFDAALILTHQGLVLGGGGANYTIRPHINDDRRHTVEVYGAGMGSGDTLEFQINGLTDCQGEVGPNYSRTWTLF